MTGTIAATVLVEKPVEVVWAKWTHPADIMQWNIPFDNWQCPSAENDVSIGGRFFFRMESKDGKEGFDHKGKYDNVIPFERIEYVGDDGRKSVIEFQQIDENTIVRESFEPEMQTPVHIQLEFCQSVLNRFKKYVEET